MNRKEENSPAHLTYLTSTKLANDTRKIQENENNKWNCLKR